MIFSSTVSCLQSDSPNVQSLAQSSCPNCDGEFREVSSYLSTVRWSNVVGTRKWGFFLQSTDATPCGHSLKRKLTPENPAADTMVMAAVAMVLP